MGRVTTVVDRLVLVRRDVPGGSTPGREWKAAVTQFAILYADRFTPEWLATGPHTELRTGP